MDSATNPQTTVKNILERLSDLENHPEEEIVPYQEFDVEGQLYYFTPVGFSTAGSRELKRWGATSAAISPVRHGGRELSTAIKGPSRSESSLARGPRAT